MYRDGPSIKPTPQPTLHTSPPLPTAPSTRTPAPVPTPTAPAAPPLDARCRGRAGGERSGAGALLGGVERAQGVLEAVDVVVDEPFFAEVLLAEERHEGEVAV